jgi:hypothetical protein
MRRLLVASLIFLAGLALVACEKPGAVRLAEGPRDYTAKDYDKTLDTWTREVELISVDEMDTVLSVTSTFQSWDFRWAYTERYARDYRLTPSEKRQFLDRSLAESKEFHQFYVALYAQHPKWGELNVDDPAWIVRLIDSTGSETEPAEVHRVKKPSAMEQTYYPYASSFRSVYRISFPTRVGGRASLNESADWFGLRFAGAQGTTKVTWEIE